MLPHSLGKLELPMNFNAVIKCEVMKKKIQKKFKKKNSKKNFKNSKNSKIDGKEFSVA